MHLAPARKALVPFLQSKGIKKIDTVFVTHPHKDHYLGLLAILNRNGMTYDLDQCTDGSRSAKKHLIVIE